MLQWDASWAALQKNPQSKNKNGPLQVQTGRCEEIALALPNLPVADDQ